MFYANWSGASIKLLPLFEEAAAIFKREVPPVPFAKVEAEANPDIISRWNVYEFPKLLYYVHGKSKDFNTYKPDIGKLKDFVRKYRAPHSVEVKDESQLELLKSNHRVLVGYFGPKNRQYHAYQQATQAFQDIYFVHNADPNFQEGIGGTLVMFKNYEDEERVDYTGNFTARDIKNFVIENRFPAVQPFTDEEVIERVFTRQNPAIVLFTDHDIHEFPAFLTVAKELSEEGLVFSHASYKHGLGSRFAEYIGVRFEHLPSVWAIRPTDEHFHVHKYRMRTNFTE